MLKHASDTAFMRHSRLPTKAILAASLLTLAACLAIAFAVGRQPKGSEVSVQNPVSADDVAARSARPSTDAITR